MIVITRRPAEIGQKVNTDHIYSLRSYDTMQFLSLKSITNYIRTFFLTLMPEFSSTLMQWFFRTRPSFGTGPSSFSLYNQNFSWNRFRLFTPFTALAIAPVEAHYSRDLVSHSYTLQVIFILENQHPLFRAARTWP